MLGFLVAAVIGAGVLCLKRYALRHGSLNVVGIVVLAGFAAVYAGWICLVDRKHAWKWLILLFMALGLLAIGLPVRGNYFEVGWQVALFAGLVWFGSGAATLYSYMRHAQPSPPEAE